MAAPEQSGHELRALGLYGEDKTSLMMQSSRRGTDLLAPADVDHIGATNECLVVWEVRAEGSEDPVTRTVVFRHGEVVTLYVSPNIARYRAICGPVTSPEPPIVIKLYKMSLV